MGLMIHSSFVMYSGKYARWKLDTLYTFIYVLGGKRAGGLEIDAFIARDLWGK